MSWIEIVSLVGAIAGLVAALARLIVVLGGSGWREGRVRVPFPRRWLRPCGRWSPPRLTCVRRFARGSTGRFRPLRRPTSRWWCG